jgi:hypothetical protein
MQTRSFILNAIVYSFSRERARIITKITWYGEKTTDYEGIVTCIAVIALVCTVPEPLFTNNNVYIVKGTVVT